MILTDIKYYQLSWKQMLNLPSHNLKTCFFWEAKKKQCLLKVTGIRSASYVQDATVTEHVHVAEIV